MADAVHLKTASYPIPLFRHALKAYPTIQQQSATSYLFLNNIAVDDQLQDCRYISQMYQSSQYDKSSCLILLEGQCFDKFVRSKSNGQGIILKEGEIWTMIVCLSRAFNQLKRRKLADKLTHFKQYSIRKIEQSNIKYKLLFHSSMISQLDCGIQGLQQWSSLYYSPQQLLNHTFIPQKSIIFSFGCLLLNLCALCDRHRNIYKTDKYQINEALIKYKVNLASGKYNYSRNLLQLIIKCMEINVQKRYGFRQFYYQVQHIIQRNQKISRLIDFNKDMKKIDEIEECKSRQQNIGSQIQQQNQSLKIVKYRDRYLWESEYTNEKKHTKSNSEKSIIPYPQQNHTNFVRSQAVDNISERKLNNSSKSQKTTSNKIKLFKQELYNSDFSSSDQDYPLQSPQQIRQNPKQEQANRQSNNLNINMNYRGTFGPMLQQLQMVQTVKKQKNYSQKQKNKINTNSLQTENKKNKYEIPRLIINNNNNESNNNIDENNQNVKKFQQLVQSSPNSPRFKISRRLSQNTYFNNIETHNYKKHICHVPQLLQVIGAQRFTLKQCRLPINELLKTINIRNKQQKGGQIFGIWTQGDVYYGNVKQNKRHGLAVQIYANNDYYYGHYINDLYHGTGFYQWASGEYFFGIFQKGVKIYGRLQSQGEARYQGQFKADQKHGQGTCWYATGQIYSGGWLNGQRNGHGSVIESNGPQFIGMWENGIRKGEGCLQTDHVMIAGNWNGDQIQGQSLIQYSNGDVFIGKTNQNLQKVFGQYLSHSGQKFQGNFEQNTPKQGKFTYQNGDVYTGKLQRCLRDGNGLYQYNNGSSYKGQWDKNKRLK